MAKPTEFSPKANPGVAGAPPNLAKLEERAQIAEFKAREAEATLRRLEAEARIRKLSSEKPGGAPSS
jgi:hypothetical protein